MIISTLLPCFSFIRDFYLGITIRGGDDDDDGDQKNIIIPSLPDDVLFDILSRLPADYLVKLFIVCKGWKTMICSRSFVKLQRERASPQILVQYLIDERLYVGVVNVKGNSNNGLIRVDSLDVRPKVSLTCDGIILFNNFLDDNVGYYFLFNPVTNEKIAVAPNSRGSKGTVHGFFFDPVESDYKLLLIDLNQTKTSYIYFVYSIRTRTWRQLPSRYLCLPSEHASHANLNGALHWIVEHDFRRQSQINDPCKNAIMVFNISTEKMYTIPHPGKKCLKTMHHHKMYLFERDRNLCFCKLDVDSEEINIWILNDYANHIWSYKYRMIFDFRWGLNLRKKLNDLKVLNFWKGELFFDWKNVGFFHWDLKEDYYWHKIHCKEVKPAGVERIYSSAFTSSLVTLLD